MRRGFSDATPFAIALVPFALAIGNASAIAGLSAWEAMFGAVAILAGASQLAAIEVIAAGGGVLAAAMVVALINLRLVFYGAGVASWFAELPLRRRLALAIPIVDQSFILCQERFEEETDSSYRQAYYLAVTATLIAAFIPCQLLAFHLGAGIPGALGLHMAAPLAFVGMLAKALTHSATLTAATIAAIVVVISSSALAAFALPLGVACGVAVAMKVPS